MYFLFLEMLSGVYAGIIEFSRVDSYSEDFGYLWPKGLLDEFPKGCHVQMEKLGMRRSKEREENLINHGIAPTLTNKTTDFQKI